MEGATYSLICSVNKITPWSRVLLEKLTGSHVVKKFPAFYGSRINLVHAPIPLLEDHLNVILPPMPGFFK